MNRKIFAQVILAGALLSACGGSAIEGDWFFCEDTRCAELDDMGLRFGDDGWGYVLDAPGTSLDFGEAYEVEDRFAYELSGDTLSFEREIFEIAIEDDAMGLVRPSDGATAVLIRVQELR
ncbi:MAG: hypothetical protein IT384_18420 [Deltaproteobacteria bacterium]|nr:hypothetical protein [Deltaproteobacteria bacterium]